MFASLLPSPAADFVLQQSPPRRRSRCRDQHHHDHNPQQRFSRPPSRQPPPPPTPARTAAAASPFPLSQQDEPGPGGSPAGLFLPKRLDPKSRRRRERKDAPEADAGALSRAGPTGPNLASAAVAAAAHNSAPHPGAPPRIAPAPASAAAEALPAAGSSGRRTHPSWRSLSALNAVASVLLTPLSLPSTSSARSNLVPDVSFLAPELLKEHRVRMYEDLAAGATLRSSRSAGGPPQSPSRWSDAAADEVSAGEVADRSRQRRKSDARRRKASAAAVHDDDTALPAQPTAAFRRDLASFSPTEDDLAAVSPEVSLFTAFQATVACVAERGQDEEDDQTEDEGGNGASVVFRRRKSGRRRSRTIGGLAAVPEVPPAGAARAELSRAKCALVRECERIEARKVQAEKDLQEVESLLLNLATKRDKLQLRLLELEERQEGVSGSRADCSGHHPVINPVACPVVEVNARLSGMSSERARIHYRKQPNSAFASAVASGRRSTEEYEHEAGTCLAVGTRREEICNWTRARCMCAPLTAPAAGADLQRDARFRDVR
ncbi:MAG: hypothetical protein BJ554DRAFT_7561 [Olpidium bornovanus]|uniref:Uncharacterized protein n=1 Tax=Olpidium bornovanus TaxID=278681 RepID=A0A8H8DM75_9FUNG|nr:MAG: hypothetical protein BJ554DRAFT_7561 [Olpidium bornovanus]